MIEFTIIPHSAIRIDPVEGHEKMVTVNLACRLHV